MATATVVPDGTEIDAPFTFNETWSGMRVLLASSGRQIGLDWNLWFCSGDLVGQNFGCGQGSGDSQAFVSCGEEQGWVTGPRSNKWQLVGRRGAKACPDANRGELSKRWHVFLRALQHADCHFLVYFLVLGSELPRGTDQDLPSAARLYVEGYGIASDGVRAL